jgi:murein L,D-transpeptidase YcbB/YkuD
MQQPGKSNSLGLIKFEFHNKYGVYLHDTPNKNLFNRDIRAFSHGCMRCQNPLDLAKLILDYDSVPNKRNYFTRDSLDTLIKTSKHQELKLVSGIPIYVEYVSVTIGEEFPVFHFDIYRKEEDIISFLSN